MPTLDIGKKLAEFRRQSGRKQAEIAIKADIHNTTLSKIENGYIFNVSLFIKVLDVYKELLSWTDKEYKDVLEGLNLSTSGNQKGNVFQAETSIFKNYIGNYYLYCPSTKHDGDFTAGRLSIELLNGLLIVSDKYIDFEYHGKATVSDQNIYLELEGKDHFEKILCIFNNPLHRNIRKLWGVLCAISVIWEPFTAICLLTEDCLDSSTVQKEFDTQNFMKEKFSFKIARDISLYTDNKDPL